jgi:superfamily II DNA or RNA helicase
LVLSERVAHLGLLADALADAAPEVPAAVLTGEDTAKHRGQVLDDLRAGRLRVLFATKLADEGLDVPALGRVFLTTGGRNAGRLQQQLGRVMRPAPGKAAPLVLDFVDPLVGVLAAQARARAQVYRGLGARLLLGVKTA